MRIAELISRILAIVVSLAIVCVFAYNYYFYHSVVRSELMILSFIATTIVVLMLLFIFIVALFVALGGIEISGKLTETQFIIILLISILIMLIENYLVSPGLSAAIK